MDYNIYIHSLGEQGRQSFTQPWNQSDDSPTKPWSSQKRENGQEENMEVTQAAEQIYSGAKAGGKAGLVTTLAVIVIKTAKQIYKGVADFQATTTGDFRASIAYNNYEAMKSNILHPISTTYNLFKTMVQNQVQTQRNQLQRELLGDSDLSSFMNRGY